MTQLLEPATGPGVDTKGDKKCIFCGSAHQDQAPAGPHTFDRNMPKLKREGRQETIALGRASRYPAPDKPPLVDWPKDISEVGGYKAAAHHCIAFKSVSAHDLSGELNEAGYDPNAGSNCIWLPFSRPHFIRARAYTRPLQKHRGGHADKYFRAVDKHLNRVAETVAKTACKRGKKATREQLLQYMKTQEKQVWLAVAACATPDYHLYTESFLDPAAPWGAYDEEAGKAKADICGAAQDPSALSDDVAAEAESADDAD